MAIRETLLSQFVGTGSRTLPVASSIGFEVNEGIGVSLDNGTVFWTSATSIPDHRTINILAGLPSNTSAGKIVYGRPQPSPKPAAFFNRVIEPPTDRWSDADRLRWFEDIWKRGGGYNSFVADLTGLTASVTELNYSTGVTGPLQPQLDSKLSDTDVGTMAFQNANSVAITGGSIVGVTLTGLNLDNATITNPTITSGSMSGTSITNSSITVNLGSSGTAKKPLLMLNANTTPVSTVDSSEDNLMTFTLLANSLNVNGSSLEINAFGTFAANANNKQIRLYFGTALLADSGSVAVNDGAWQIKVTLTRIGASSQISIANIIAGNTVYTAPCQLAQPTQALGSSAVIKVTGQGVAASDITQNGLIITVLPI